jgi:hypothetical protein
MAEWFVRLRRHWPLALTFVVVAIAFQAWLRPGLIAGEDFQPVSAEALSSYLPFPPLWDRLNVYGSSQVYWASSFPLYFIAGILARIGAGWPVIERLLYLWPIMLLLPGISYATLYRMTRFPGAAAAGALVMSINSWSIGLVERGHLPALCSVAFMPLAVYGAHRVFSGSRRAALYFSAAIVFQVMYEPRYAYESCMAVALLGLTRMRSVQVASDVVRRSRWLGIAIGGVLLLNLYWIVPQVIFPNVLPADYASSDAYRLNSAFLDFSRSVSLFFPYYHHVAGTDGFISYPLEPGFAALPAVVLMLAILSWSRRWTRFAVVLALVATLLASGPNGVFGPVNLWLFAHVPGLQLFRDSSKLLALIAFAYSMILANGMLRLRTWFALRVADGRHFQVASALLVVCFVSLYSWLMSDAFNTTRLSNFAATKLNGQDLALQSWLDRTDGAFRTIVFPTALPMLTPTSKHPLLWANWLSVGEPPEGTGEFSPDTDNLLAWFASPLAPELVRAANVRYVVVFDDPLRQEYRSFTYRVERAQAIDQFRALPWLVEERHFGKIAVFRVRGWRSQPAYIADQPALLFGTPASSLALAGTPFWSDSPGVMFASQLSLTNSAFARLHNVIEGAWPVRADASKDTIERNLRLEALAEATERTQVFHGYAFSSAAMAEPNAWGKGATFSNSFVAAATRTARADVLLAVDQDFDGETRRFRASDVAPVAPGEATQLCDSHNSDAFVSSDGLVPLDPAQPSRGLALQGSRIVVLVLNPCLHSQIADIVLPRIVARARGLTVQTELPSGRTVRFNVPHDDFLARIFPPPVLRNVEIDPGTTRIVLSVIGNQLSASQITVVGKAALSYVRQQTDTAHWRTFLPVVSPRGRGALLSAEVLPDSSEGAIGYARLYRPTSVRMDSRPKLELRYVAPQPPAALSIVLRLRQRTTNALVDVWVPCAPQGDHTTVDVFERVAEALDRAWDETLLAHADDDRWLLAHRLDGPYAVSDYVLEEIRLAVLVPPGALGSDADAGHFDVGVTGAELGDERGGVVPEVPHRIARTIDLGILAKNGIQAPEQVPVDRSVSSRNALFTLRSSKPSQATRPDNIDSGDQVVLRLNDGTTVAGVVDRIDNTTVVVETDGKELGINRAAIATVGQRYVGTRGSAELSIPVPASPEATTADYLAFDLGAPRDSRVSVRLRFRLPSGAVREVPPTMEQQPNDVVPQIPPEWITPAEDLNDTRPLGRPVATSANAAAAVEAATWTHYQLPLAPIRAYHLGADNQARLVGLDVRIETMRASPAAQFLAYGIRSLELETDVQTVLRLPRAVREAITVDGAPVGVDRVRALEVPGQLTGSGSVALRDGSHTANSEVVLPYGSVAALISSGSPPERFSGEVTALAEGPSTARLHVTSGTGGLLVWPTSFDRGWGLALRPSSPDVEPLLRRWWSLRASFLSSDDHVVANGSWNGWFLPPGTYDVELVYLPELVMQLAIGGELVAGLALLAFVLVRRRRARP